MAKDVKIVKSKTAPVDKNVLWDDGENLKIYRNGVWENTNKNAGGEIDPVVWKYMCNPHIVEYEPSDGSCNNAIPKELSDIIYQNGKFNHLVLSTILIKIVNLYEEGVDEWTVERITSYDNYGNVTFFDARLAYDPKTRLFVV